QRWCPSQSNSEYVELLEGFHRRLLLLGVAPPEMAVVDNCCHVKAAILQVFPDIAVVLDVWHFIQRYLACVLHGSKNPHRLEVGQDISDAILKSKASNGNPARYWSKAEQEERLVRAYEKWVKHGDVWSAAAEKVHADQLAHVKKGCLARPRDDVPSDGSRIEGSHKGWNGLQRSHASGVESQTALGHDHVLRRNTRVEFASDSPSAFVASTYGCHHVRLVDWIACKWNEFLVVKQKAGGLPAGMTPLSVLEPAPSKETFGLMKMSAATAAHYTFVKQEPEDDLLDLSAHVDPTSILNELGIDPTLAHLLPSHARPSKEKRRASSAECATTFEGQCDDAQINDGDPHAELASLSLNTPPAKKLRLFVEGSAKGKSSTTKDKVRDLLAMSVPLVCLHADLYSQKSGDRLSSFFAPSVRDSVTVAGHGNYQTPCLPIVRITGLTRSQQVFSLATGLDPRSITFARSEKDAFFLFMDLRKQLQWATYKMSSRDWVTAATLYNHAVEKKNAAEGRALVRKTPRALLDKLHEVESAIIQRVGKGNYKSQSGTTKFWYQHCHAVPLRLLKPAERQQRTPVCTRCKVIMYPGGENSPQNHKRGVCSDGARTTPQKISRTINGRTVHFHEDPPQWPQPIGIFKEGKTFNGHRFLAALEEMYDRVVKNGDVDSERTMEYLALTSLLQSRLEYTPATESRAAKALFRLFDGLELEDCPAEIVVEHEGSRFLHINYLCQEPALAS
ncbi:hypothetical protein C8T65DRAFT_562727, partial [Cerioporus squamosus]